MRRPKRHILLMGFCLLLGNGAGLGQSHQQFGQGGQRAVPQVDLARYAGSWYEIARTENFWQRGCASDVTARYDLQSGGKFTIHNACKKANGGETTGDGYAVGSGNGQLVDGKMRVSFFRPFYFDYWVIALDANYAWAAVVEPKRQNIWIIARAPVMDKATRELIDRKIADAGFDPKTLVDTKQSVPMAAKR